MKNKALFFGSLFTAAVSFLSAGPYPPPPPQVIQQQLEDAEHEFYEARQMFNPWYAGPLITGSAHTLDPGLFNMQPYLYVIDNYGRYNTHRDSVDIPDLVQVNPVIYLQTGIYKGFDITIGPGYIYNKQKGVSSSGFADFPVSLGIQIINERPYIPAVRVVITETFPTGKYDELNPSKNGLDAIGAGSYQTNFSLNFGKVVWWISTHPIALRFSMNFKIPSKVHVKGFNAYGGGYHTDGHVRVGKTFTGDIGIEYSFTQRWVLATDIVYTYSGKSSFYGIPGVDATGKPAFTGGPFSDQLSLAPAIEYNPSGSIGILGGVWFSVYGRSSFNFVSGILSYTQVF